MNDKLLIDRTLLEQALKALENASDIMDSWAQKRQDDAITALRAALAQQPEPVAAVAENATTQQRVVETPPSDYRRGYWDGFNIGKREGRIEAEDALAQQPKPVQEPVAWATEIIDALQAQYNTEMIKENDSGDALIRLDDAIAAVEDAEKHYTAPPQRPPLTDEEIAEATAGVLGLPHEIKVELARAIERKVRGE